MLSEGWTTEAKHKKSVIFPEVSNMKKKGLIEYVENEGYRIKKEEELGL